MKASTTVARRRASRAFTRITCACVLAICTGQSASAAIPAGERQALLDLYNQTGGPSWFDNVGWGGEPGTECGWVSVRCNDEGTHVIELDLFGNELSGTLPPLDGLTALQALAVNYNDLHGTVPDLSGLVDLVDVNLRDNQFIGDIPALPSGILLFDAVDNLLTGSIPLLSAYPELTSFVVSHNHLSGEIPSLSDLHALLYFEVDDNDLEGPVPALDGLLMLYAFNASANHLTGSLPALVHVPNLDIFDVRQNNLTGTIPPFGDLIFLHAYNVDHNQLTGPPPPGPLPSQVLAVICPNLLDHVESQEWDDATGVTPWYRDCVLPDAVFADGFDG